MILVAVLLKLTPEIETSELVEFAALGAFVFVLQSIIIPIKFFGVLLTLSGVPLVIMVKGIRRGLVISVSAIILNHLFIPGAFSMLGINLTNMIIAGLIAGLIPSVIYSKMGKRVRYLSGLLGGMTYFAVITTLIFIELSLSTLNLSSENIRFILEIILFAAIIMGILEGLLTAIGSSYYHRVKNPKQIETVPQYSDEQEDEIELIEFMDDETGEI